MPDPIRAGDPPTPLPSEVLAGQGVAAFVLRPADLDRLPTLTTYPPNPSGDEHAACRAIQAGEREAAEEQADALRAEVARLTGLLDDASAEADRADRAERELAACRAEVVRLGEQFYRADSDGYLDDAENYRPDPALGASPEVVALMRLDRILGNERALSEKGTGRVRGVVLDALRAWHTRRTAGVSGVDGDLLVIPETFLPTPEHPAALRVSGPGLVEYDGHELRIEYDDEEPARPGLAPDPTIDDPTVIPLRHRQHPTPDAWPDNAITVTYRELRRLVHLHLTVAVAGMPREKPWEWIKARARAVDDGEAPLLLSEVLDR